MIDNQIIQKKSLQMYVGHQNFLKVIQCYLYLIQYIHFALQSSASVRRKPLHSNSQRKQFSKYTSNKQNADRIVPKSSRFFVHSPGGHFAT